MGKSSAPAAPAPDPNIGRAAMKQAQTGEDMLSFMRDAYGQNMERQEVTDALSREVTQDQLGASRQQQTWAKEDRARYQGVFQPLQDDLVKTATEWDSPERQAKMAGEARADVMSNASLAKNAGNRNLAAMGVDPTSGRFAGINRGADLATGLAAAGAQNNARNTSRTQALALKESAVNLGNGLPASASNAASLGIGAGSTALGSNMAANGQFNQAVGQMSSGFGGAMQGYQGQAGTLTGLHNSNMQAWQGEVAQTNANNASIGNTIGSIAGIAAMAFM